MTRHLADAGLCDFGVVMNAYDERTDVAIARIVSTLPPEKGHGMIDSITNAAEVAQTVWESLFRDTEQNVVEELA
eukprot:8850271-Karenia_brevis.AAC.1